MSVVAAEESSAVNETRERGEELIEMLRAVSNSCFNHRGIFVEFVLFSSYRMES